MLYPVHASPPPYSTGNRASNNGDSDTNSSCGSHVIRSNSNSSSLWSWINSGPKPQDQADLSRPSEGGSVDQRGSSFSGSRAIGWKSDPPSSWDVDTGASDGEDADVEGVEGIGVAVAEEGADVPAPAGVTNLEHEGATGAPDVDVDVGEQRRQRQQAQATGRAQTEERSALARRRRNDEASLRGGGGTRSGSGYGSSREVVEFKARRHRDVTVIFIDIVGFSEMCNEVVPFRVLRFLERYFSLVDEVAEEHGVTKLRTVGDGYLAVAGIMADMGVEEDAHQHVLRSLTFGLGVLSQISNVALELPNGKELRCRVGMAHGQVFSGVVGRSCVQYDIFGDVANLAARMEQTCPYGAVHMPKRTFEKMQNEMTEDQDGIFDGVDFKTHEKVAIKNMGEIDTVSLLFSENEERIAALLIGCLSDDNQRAVTVHIGVQAESFRQKSWHGERSSGSLSKFSRAIDGIPERDEEVEDADDDHP